MWRSEVGAICLMGTRCLLANAYEKDFCFGQTITWVHSHSRSWSNVLTLAILLWSILVEINKLFHVIFYDNSFRMFFFVGFVALEKWNMYVCFHYPVIIWYYQKWVSAYSCLCQIQSLTFWPSLQLSYVSLHNVSCLFMSPMKYS